MNKLVILFAIFLIFGFGNNCFAQDVPGVPNGAMVKSSPDDYDNGIRIRSIELERVKSESYRIAAAEKAAKSRKINYSQIKEDFELLQKLQNEIVRTYVTGKQINYARISELSSKLNDRAERLDVNLSLSTEKNAKKSDKNISDPENVKDVIIVLDKAIGNFVINPVFKNLGVIEPNDAEKAQLELQNIIRLSNVLAQKSEILK